MPEINCFECSKLFKTTNARLKKNNGKSFCSGKCSSIYRWKHSIMNRAGYTHCKNCNKKFYRPAERVNKNCYCNNSCQMKYEYKTGIRDKDEITKKANQSLRNRTIKRLMDGTYSKYIGKRGYYIFQHPIKGRILEHRYIWEKHNGAIPKGMHIHHINGDKLDNRIENLKLISPEKHAKSQSQKTDSLGRFIKN